MPGHVGTDIALNARSLLGRGAKLDADELSDLRARLKAMGVPADGMTDQQIEEAVQARLTDFRERAPLKAAGAATLILNGVREGKWRILIGEDAKLLDGLVREHPEEAYEPGFFNLLNRPRKS
jgi:hypothetical protein